MTAVFRINNGKVANVFFKVSVDLEKHVAEIECCGITQQKDITMISIGKGELKVAENRIDFLPPNSTVNRETISVTMTPITTIHTTRVDNKLSKLDEAKRKQIGYLVLKEGQPFSFHDFLNFEINGFQYHMSHEHSVTRSLSC